MAATRAIPVPLFEHLDGDGKISSSSFLACHGGAAYRDGGRMFALARPRGPLSKWSLPVISLDTVQRLSIPTAMR